MTPEDNIHEKSWDAFLEAYSKLLEDNKRLRDILDDIKSCSNCFPRDESELGK